MDVTRRGVLAGGASLALSALSGCAARFGTSGSYLTKVIEPDRNNVVFHWTDVALQAVRDQLVPPPLATRGLAMGHVAGFLAVNGLVHRYDSHYRVGEGPVGADPEIAYAAAAATAFAEHFQQPFLLDRERFMARYPDSEAKTLGRDWGDRIGRFMIRERTNDGAEPSRADYYLGRFPRRSDALRWTPTGPLYDSSATEPAFRPTFRRGLLPGFGMVKPWAMASGSQFRAPPFPDPRSAEFARDFVRIKTLGAADSTVRTSDETQIAFYWEDGVPGVTPPGHFTLIAMQLFQHRDMPLVDLARAMALNSIAMADAAISSWDSKYHHDVIRPETAIRYRAPDFGNPDPRVTRDRRWRSLTPTPPFPAYTSGHSTFGAASTRMIAQIMGRDDIAFSKSAADTVLWPEHLPGVTRHWPSLSAAAEENGASRLYGGVHWSFDNTHGLRAGRAIADLAFRTLFRRKT